MGRRLGEHTKDNTKCMLPVNGVRLIDRMLTQLSTLSLRRVVIVVGYKAQNLIRHIGDRYEGALNIEFIENPIYDKTNNIYSLALAKHKLQEDDTILLESDLIFEDGMLEYIMSSPHANVALVAKYETWMDGTMVRINDNCDILNFVPKKAFRYEDVDSYYKTVNIYKFSRQFLNEQYVPFLEAYSKAMGNNEYYEQVLRIITALDRTDLKALPIGNRKWYEIDDIQDLDIAETLFADDEHKLSKYYGRYGGFWRYPQMLDFCYLVNPYFPTQRMKDEMRANFDILLAEYPSGMRVNSMLAAKYFGISQAYAVVGNGAAELIKALMDSDYIGRMGMVFPTFEEYPNRLSKDRLETYTPDNADFKYSASNLTDYFADKGIDTLLIVNPDNPSGHYIPLDDVLTLARWCAQRGIRLIVDESFVDFTYGWRDNSLLSDLLLEANPQLVVIKSISKSYGVPGLRLGVLASADRKLVDMVRREVAIWNINSFAEFYMQIFSKYEGDYFTACDRFIAERARFAADLSSIPWLRIVPSQANYFLCEVTDRFTSRSLTERLLIDHNILIKDCATKKGFDGKNYVRIAVRDTADNSRLANILKSL